MGGTFYSLVFVCKAHLPAVGRNVHRLRNVRLCISNIYLYLNAFYRDNNIHRNTSANNCAMAQGMTGECRRSTIKLENGGKDVKPTWKHLFSLVCEFRMLLSS